MNKLNSFFRFVFLMSFSILLFSCSAIDSFSPVMRPAQKLVRGIFSGRPNQAMDQLCVQEGGVVAIIAIDANWGQEDFEVLSQTDDTAVVRVEGRVRMSANNIDRYIEELQKIKVSMPDLKIPNIDLPRTGVGIQLNINYSGLEMQKGSRGWCVTRNGVYGFYEYIFAQIISALE